MFSIRFRIFNLAAVFIRLLLLPSSSSLLHLRYLLETDG